MSVTATVSGGVTYLSGSWADILAGSWPTGSKALPTDASGASATWNGTTWNGYMGVMASMEAVLRLPRAKLGSVLAHYFTGDVRNSIYINAGVVTDDSAPIPFASASDIPSGVNLGPSVSVAGVLWVWDGVGRYTIPTQNNSAIAIARTNGRILLLSESILAVANFPLKLADATGREVDSDVAIGGSHIGIGLAAVADESYSYGYADNACAHSDDLTGAGWGNITANDCTKTKSYLGNETWTKLVNSSGTATPGMRYTTSIPASGDSITLLVELVTVGSQNPAQGAFLNIRRMDTLASLSSATVNLSPTYVDGSVLACVHVPYATAASLFGTGVNIGAEVRFSDATVGCSMYVRNVTLSFRSPYGFTPTVKTTGTSVSSSLGWFPHSRMSAYRYKYDAAVVSFGRNEANAFVPARAHKKAYRAIICAAKKICNHVVPTNPPCTVYDGGWDERSYTQEYKNAFLGVVVATGCGVDVHSGIQAFPPATVMDISGGFSQHESEAGADWMATMISQAIAYGESRMPSLPENPVRVYWDGIRTGTWTQKVGGSKSLRRKRAFDVFSSAGNDSPLLGASSSAPGDTVTFTVGACTQAYILADQGDGLGVLEVSVDGTVVGRISTAVAGQSIPSMIAWHAFSDMSNTAHSVVVSVVSGTVGVYGIVTI